MFKKSQGISTPRRRNRPRRIEATTEPAPAAAQRATHPLKASSYSGGRVFAYLFEVFDLGSRINASCATDATRKPSVEYRPPKITPRAAWAAGLSEL